MDTTSGEEKRMKRGRPKLDHKDLATRITTTNAGENYQEVCIKNVFERIKFQGTHDGKPVKRPEIPNADISVSVPSIIAENLKRMGITQLLPTQRYTLPLLTDHDTDLFVGAATGHGKTLAFLLPIAVSLLRAMPRQCSSSKRPLALVIANTQVLQVQTFNVATSLLMGTGLKAVLVCGQTPMFEAAKSIEKGVDIIIATTGRLLEFIKSDKIQLDGLRFFIYDEADKMTQHGAFRQDVTEISEHIPPETRPHLRSCFFTATLDAISAFDNMYRTDQYCMVLVPGNPLITHQLLPIDPGQDNDHAKSLILMQLLLKDVKSQGRTLFDKSTEPYLHKTVVFVGLKIRCNYLAAYLRMYGYSVGVANSDLSLQKRNQIIQRFCDGEIQALIATDSMARGHDIPNVTHVINFDMSDNALDTFKHRAGRTARIGHKGTCTTFLSRSQFELFDDPNIVEISHPRQRAAELARYLVIECGQRIPKCLVKSTYIAITTELDEMGVDMTPEAALEAIGAYEMEEEKTESPPPQPTPTQVETTKATPTEVKPAKTTPTQVKPAEVTPAEVKPTKTTPPPPTRTTPSPPTQAKPSTPTPASPTTSQNPNDVLFGIPPMEPIQQLEDPSWVLPKNEHRVVKVIKPAKLATMVDEDGVPIFDASASEMESEDEDEEDNGGVTIDESEFDDDSYFNTADYHADSDSDAPRDAIFADSPSAENVDDDKPRVWTDSDEDENKVKEGAKEGVVVDADTEAERVAALKAAYEETEEKEEETDEDEEENEEDTELNDDEVD